jgi:hypothetical protein
MNTVSTNQSTSGRLKSGQGNMHFKIHEQKVTRVERSILAASAKAFYFKIKFLKKVW